MSSYQFMDHAGWVQSNNAAMNRLRARRRNYEVKPEKLTEFQAKVCDLLGMVFGGIYNAPIAWESADWDYGKGVSVVLTYAKSFSTFDFSRLTWLVFLCHEARIRGELEPGGFRSFRLSFWPRGHEGAMHERHPNLEEAVKAFRDYLPADHRIIYRAPEVAAAE